MNEENENNKEELSSKGIAKDAFTGITEMDSSLPRTILHLFTKPHVVIQTNLSGDKKTYFNPFKYVIMVVTVNLFLFSLIGFDSEFITKEFSKSFSEYNLEDILYVDKVAEAMTLVFGKYMIITMMIGIPICSFASFFAFRSYKISYLKHILINAYIYGQFSIIGIVFLPVMYLFMDSYNDISLAYSGIYYSWVFIKLFNGNRFSLAIKCVLGMLLYVMTMFLYGGLIALPIIIYYFK